MAMQIEKNLRLWYTDIKLNFIQTIELNQIYFIDMLIH